MPKALSLFSRALFVTCVAVLPIVRAQASGPPERLLQVMLADKDPNSIVVRYGVPGGRSNGLLFSKDGGRTFRASCSSLVSKDLKMQRSQSPYLSTVTLERSGKLALWQDTGVFYSGETDGCTFTKIPGFERLTIAAVVPDPTDANGVYVLAFGYDANNIAQTNVMRRDGQGKFTTVGPVRRSAATENVLGMDLIATQAGNVTRMVVMYSVWTGTNFGKYFVGLSEDGGATWNEHPFPGSSGNDGRLLGFDPTNPDRVVALDYRSDVADKLMVSSDRGATYTPWGTVEQYSAITFGADGRVFISASGSGTKPELVGVWTAAKVGEPLTRLPLSDGLDCLSYRSSDQKLFACKVQQFGTIDSATGAFTSLSAIEGIEKLVECPDRKASDVCEAELNSGTAWCCTGHYPFTPFCGQYDIRSAGKLCGQAGREYDCQAGRAPPNCREILAGDAGTSLDGGARDAGTRDAGLQGGVDAGARPRGDASASDDDDDDDDEPGGASDDGGCSCRAAARLDSGASPLAIAIGLLLFLSRRARRRMRS